MRRAFSLAACVLAGAPLTGAARAPQATSARADYDPPATTEIQATFDEAAKATRYAVEVTYDKNDGPPLFKWDLTPPADDPHCSKLLGAEQRGTVRDAGGGRLTARSTATWHHSDGDGCSHKGFQHYGWVSVLVFVHHKETYGTFNLQCSAQYLGTLTGSGETGGRQEATCDRAVPPPKKIPGKAPVDFKTRAEIEAAYYADLVDTYTVEGAIFGACGAVPGPTQIACALAGGAAAYLVYLCGKEKEQWEKIVKDPADPNFRVVARPVPVKFAIVGQAEGLTTATAAAANALGSGTGRALGLGEALMTSINRQLGAYNAHDVKAQRLQERAAATYAVQLAAALKALAPLRARLRAAVAAAGVDLGVTPTDFAAAQQKLRRGAFPAPTEAVLVKMGMTKAAIAQLKAHVQARRPPSHVLVFPAMLDDPGLARADAASAAALLRFARLLK